MPKIHTLHLPQGGVAIRKAVKNGWSSPVGGQYESDTKYGGGSILDSGKDSINVYRYGVDRVYEATPWDSNYNIGEKKVFTTLSSAKKYVETYVEEQYKKLKR